MLTGKVIRIAHWCERYEVSDKGRAAREGDKLRTGPLAYLRVRVSGRGQDAEYMRLRQVAGTATRLEACIALFPRLLQIAADNPVDLRGMVLDEQGQPATVEDLEFFTGLRKRSIQAALTVLADSRVQWIELAPFPGVPGDSRGFPETPGKSGTLLEYRTEQNKTETETETGDPGDPAAEGGSVSDSEEGPDFLAFWAAYPRQVGKADARKAWDKTKGTRPPLADLLAAVKAQTIAKRWNADKRPFCPYPATWLNGKRWDDAIEAEPTPGTSGSRPTGNHRPQGAPELHDPGLVTSYANEPAIGDGTP